MLDLLNKFYDDLREWTIKHPKISTVISIILISLYCSEVFLNNNVVSVILNMIIFFMFISFMEIKSTFAMEDELNTCKTRPHVFLISFTHALAMLIAMLIAILIGAGIEILIHGIVGEVLSSIAVGLILYSLWLKANIRCIKRAIKKQKEIEA